MANKDMKEKLNKLKIEAATEIGHLQYIKENNDHYKGDVPAKVNGYEGGPIGGRMVKKMIESQQNNMSWQG